MLEEKRPCTILHCPQLAVAYDQCEIADWTLRIFFCKEHQRELNAGTPMGGLGLDPTQIEITSVETARPRSDLGLPAIGP